MMSRLEKIKQHQYDGYTIWDMGEDNLVWLIEQAERVQELEKKHKEYVLFTESNNYNMDVEFGKLYKQNKRYREVIEKAFNRLNDSKRMGLEALEAFEILGQIMEESE